MANFGFDLDGQNWKELYSSSFIPGLPPCGVLALRLFLASTWLGINVYVFRWWVSSWSPAFYFALLTYWSGWTEAAYFACAAYSTFRAVCARYTGFTPLNGAHEGTPWFVRVTWILFSIMPTMALAVTLFYWTSVFTPRYRIQPATVMMHGGNVIFAVFELWCFPQPYYMSHVYTSMLYMAVYAVFTYLYDLAGGRDMTGNRGIYAAIDWSKPTQTAVGLTLIVAGLIPILYLVMFAVSGRWCRCCRRKEWPRNSEVGNPEMALA